MKKFFALLLTGTCLVAPMTAQARDGYRGPDRHHHVERTVKIKKKVVVHEHRWSRGHRLSGAERRRMARVNDYRRYRLAHPPRGHQWVKIDNDFLLVGITSGVIASIFAGR
ncbi:RcnB family protein [Sinorhizobium meliloti]|uniref:Integral membrane protein n=1 Tax=Rhizobium meliloti TaxID=382 RepID=A0A2J0YTV2_RHIML|nr:RcnB family protein [Sinorhizobium meliloti]PJR09836.1 hypothetical protein CEJ86_30465 [Sinorhizobium meliloti]